MHDEETVGMVSGPHCPEFGLTVYILSKGLLLSKPQSPATLKGSNFRRLIFVTKSKELSDPTLSHPTSSKHRVFVTQSSGLGFVKQCAQW